MCNRLRIIVTHLLLAAAPVICRGQEAPVRNLALVAPADDGRVQQYIQLLQPTMWRELDFVRQTCNLTPEQRPKVKSAADAAVKEAAKAMLKPQRQPTTMIATKAVRDGIQDALKQTLTADQLELFKTEAA